MSIDDLNRVWKSPANRPAPVESAREREAFITLLQREHRAFRFWVIRAVALLTVITIGLGVSITGDNPFDLNGEWAVLLLLALPWISAILFIRRQFQHRRTHPDYDQSVAHSVRALLDANRAAQQRSRIVQALLALSAPVMALCIWQLQAADKARPHEAASLATVMATAIVLSSIGVYVQSRRLRPEEKRLTELAAEFA
ncbi:hypothetical protein MASR2M8_00640 [Opitutaceae bacterium]